MPLFADAVAAFRSRVPSRQSSDWFYPATTGYGSLELADGISASYSTIYHSSPWVFAAVNVLGESVARMPLKVYERVDGAKNYVTTGDLYDLLQRPYPYVTPFRWKETIVKQTAIYGNCIVVKIGMSNIADLPEELFIAPSTGWKINGDTYTWTSRTGDTFDFQRWQIIHYRFWSCDESGLGKSMLEPLRMALLVEDAAQRYAASAFKNGARPSSILKTEQKLTPESGDRLKASMQAIHGGPDNAFKVAVLEQGLEWAPYPAPNLDDAALVAHRSLTAELIAAVFKIPQPALGILENANFASVDMLHTMLYQDTLGPWVTMIEETTQTDLVDSTGQLARSDQFVEFDMHGLMRSNTEAQYRGYATGINSGFLTPNEVRAFENLPPSDQPDADQLLFPLNLGSGAAGAQLAEDTGAPDDTKALYELNGAAHADAYAKT